MASARRSGLQASQASPPKLLDDSRFRALLSNDDWGRLPVATWRRFSTRHADGGTIVYVGEVDDACFSRAGWWLAQLARLIGGPLPTGTETGVPMVVTVTEDAASGGQIWTRICARTCGWRCGYRSSTKPWCFAASVTPCGSDGCDCRCRPGSRPAILP